MNIEIYQKRKIISKFILITVMRKFNLLLYIIIIINNNFRDSNHITKYTYILYIMLYYYFLIYTIEFEL